MLFAFPGELRWNDQREGVEFDVKIGEYGGIVFVERRIFQQLLDARPSPEECVQEGYLNRALSSGLPSSRSGGASSPTTATSRSAVVICGARRGASPPASAVRLQIVDSR
jgi:hypothetical protein